jgi:hypothetical protein
MLETITEMFRELHFRYLDQFLTALLPMALTMVIHGQGMGLAGRYFKRFGRPPTGSSRDGRSWLLAAGHRESELPRERTRR